jgi:hypothetical protein
VGTVSILLNLACIFAFMFGVIVGVVSESSGLTALAIFVAIAFGIGAKVYESKVSPKYKKVDTKVVVIDAPAVGEVAFYR